MIAISRHLLDGIASNITYKFFLKIDADLILSLITQQGALLSYDSEKFHNRQPHCSQDHIFLTPTLAVDPIMEY